MYCKLCGQKKILTDTVMGEICQECCSDLFSKGTNDLRIIYKRLVQNHGKSLR